jgi:hypothetical protein
MHTSPPIHRSTRVQMSDSSIVGEVWTASAAPCDHCHRAGRRWESPDASFTICTACGRGGPSGSALQPPTTRDEPLGQLLAQLA